MNKTRIEYCDMTWNPVTGCLYGCEYCYARRIAERFGGFSPCLPKNMIKDGAEYYDGLTELNNPRYIQWDNCKIVKASFPNGFKPTFHRYRLDEPHRKKKPQTIFVCSMADLFGDWVPDEWIEDVFGACEKAPQHGYLFLTKNPFRYEQLHQE